MPRLSIASSHGFFAKSLFSSLCFSSLCFFCVALIGTHGSQAGLVDGGGDLPNDLNNALRFDPATPTPVIVAYKDANLPLDRFIQVGFSTTNTTAFSIGAIAWSKDNVSYNAFTPNDFVNDIVSGGGIKLSSVIDLGAPVGGTSSTLFYLRYTLPAGISVGSVVQSTFYANSNGATSGGRLADQLNNNFISITRSHTAVPEPTSLLLAGGVVGFMGWQAARRRRSQP